MKHYCIFKLQLSNFFLRYENVKRILIHLLNTEFLVIQKKSIFDMLLVAASLPPWLSVQRGKSSIKKKKSYFPEIFDDHFRNSIKP